MLKGLEGKVALVTGGASGIGAAVATRLAAEGARVVIADLNGGAAAAHAATLPASSASSVECDVSQPEAVARAFAEAVERFGRVDLVHNNAGATGPAKPLVEIEPEEFDGVVAVNVRGVFLVLREAFAQFERQAGGGAIVNTASTAGLRGYRMRAPYAATKHAVVGLTKVAALEGAEHGVRVNAICPGPIETPFIASVAEAWGGGDIEKGRAEMSTSVPLARLGQPEEVAALVCWLLSDEAPYVTGTVIPIDGGRTAY
jgi:NAD(P)-dependent dehydrogenase (short-subunit alcohol dehydrogenase family)